jgi:hypothetical protein
MTDQLNWNTVLDHGPYAGSTVRDVLNIDPDELLRFDSSFGYSPVYDLRPDILAVVYAKAQDRLGWQEFMEIWNEVD